MAADAAVVPHMHHVIEFGALADGGDSEGGAIDGDGSEDDVAPSDSSTGTSAAALSGPQTIYVNFTGPTMVPIMDVKKTGIAGKCT